MKVIKIIPFWEKPQVGKILIKHYEYVKFLEAIGYSRMTDNSGSFGVLVKIQDNVVKLTSESEIIKDTAEYLKTKGESFVLEVFTRQASNLTSKTKLSLLNQIPLLQHQDTSDCTWMYFKNHAIKICKGAINRVEYKALTHLIWEDSIIQHELKPNDEHKSQFEILCENVSKQDSDRIKALKTSIGYLLSRYNDPSNPKAIILVDENITSKGSANGGTGKSLISQGIGKARKVVLINGKDYSSKYIFGKQNVTNSTDVIWYDDVRDNFSLEDVYSMLTSGVEVQIKHKAPIYIPPSEAPKILICSNYIVKGTSGNTDKRRRAEFELNSHYNETHQPIDDFGKLFYSEWDSVDYNRFYWTLINFAQAYLKEGLVIADEINLPINRLIGLTSEEFVNFADLSISKNVKLDKRDVLTEFNDLMPLKDQVSSHKFTKWLKIYAFEKGLEYSDQSSGGNFYFSLYENNVESIKTNNDEEE